jgi:glucose/arabinose dehydrogenase
MTVRRLLAIVALVAACTAGCASARASSATKTAYATGLTHVAAMATDADGRLWVATAAYEDRGDDAVYLVASEGATPVKVITGLHTPLGLLWHDGSLFVASKERVDTYSGLANDAFAQHAKVLSLPSGVGEVNGLALAPDGRMLLGISAPCDHCTPASKYSGAIVSFRADGADLQVYASKIRAPVGLVYAPGTSDLYVTMNQRDDLGAETPGDTLALVTEGSSYGFPEATASAPAPVAVLDQHAAVTGVAIVAAHAYVAEWSTGKVMRVSLPDHSATALKIDGLTNPTAIVTSGSNALLVGDWATGTIWRVPL